MSEPPSLVSEEYRDFTSYNIAIYTRGELFFHQLRYIVGDETMHRILRTFYERWKYKHVDEDAFRAVAEEVSHRDLSTFFAQWLHSTDLYDYAVGRVKRDARAPTARLGDAGRGRAAGRRDGFRSGRGGHRGRATRRSARTEGLAEREWVEIADPDAGRERCCSTRGSARTTGTCSTTGGGSASRSSQLLAPAPGSRRLPPPLLQHPESAATG